MDALNATDIPSDEDIDDPCAELAKYTLDWLEQCDLRQPEHLKVCISTIHRATLAHPIVPLADMPAEHALARTLRVLLRCLGHIQSATNKSR